MSGVNRRDNVVTDDDMNEVVFCIPILRVVRLGMRPRIGCCILTRIVL